MSKHSRYCFEKKVSIITSFSSVNLDKKITKKTTYYYELSSLFTVRNNSAFTTFQKHFPGCTLSNLESRNLEVFYIYKPFLHFPGLLLLFPKDYRLAKFGIITLSHETISPINIINIL